MFQSGEKSREIPTAKPRETFHLSSASLRPYFCDYSTFASPYLDKISLKVPVGVSGSPGLHLLVEEGGELILRCQGARRRPQVEATDALVIQLTPCCQSVLAVMLAKAGLSGFSLISKVARGRKMRIQSRRSGRMVEESMDSLGIDSHWLDIRVTTGREEERSTTELLATSCKGKDKTTFRTFLLVHSSVVHRLRLLPLAEPLLASFLSPSKVREEPEGKTAFLPEERGSHPSRETKLRGMDSPIDESDLGSLSHRRTSLEVEREGNRKGSPSLCLLLAAFLVHPALRRLQIHLQVSKHPLVKGVGARSANRSSISR
ncbi:hypothetical protein L6452_27862 [Arctium lappa]|uniref:Uncharacterized protein n=1 Tax=Arctium lappa TaxID=4217 RepID=A0ACB8ZXD4_ARCLA|nr:hypothetical protein L6452_27862 [Arctium lappa]